MPMGVVHSSSRDAMRLKRLAEANKPKSQQGKVKKRRLGDKVLSQNVRDLVPESKAYMDLLAFETKLDTTITRKRLEIQETLKRSNQMKQKRKLRVFISHSFIPGNPGKDNEERTVGEWELKLEGRLLDEAGLKPDSTNKLKFSFFFRNVIIELDKDVYGPDNHLTEWQRTNNCEEMDGFTVTRPGEESVKSTIILTLNYQPPQYKLNTKLAKLLSIHTATKVDIINGIWQYIKNNRLQDPQEREFINNDKYFQQIFEVPRMKFTEIPKRLGPLLLPPDPIVIHHLINADAPEGKRTACYDIDVEIVR
jgi:SWI/SNF-related matrix-associated actin-dependent regulator of chromatin subfamily D